MLHVDYGIRCEGSAYMMLKLLLVALVLLWPIGVPAMLWWQMYKKKEKIIDQDPDTVAQFQFALGDYKPTHWYWYARALLYQHHCFTAGMATHVKLRMLCRVLGSLCQGSC